MTDIGFPPARLETRRSMLRVWMAISAVWVAFWLALAAIVVASVSIHHALTSEFGFFCLIVLLPPIALLGLGAVIRFAAHALTPTPHPARDRIA